MGLHYRRQGSWVCSYRKLSVVQKPLKSLLQCAILQIINLKSFLFCWDLKILVYFTVIVQSLKKNRNILPPTFQNIVSPQSPLLCLNYFNRLWVEALIKIRKCLQKLHSFCLFRGVLQR